jgi:hypothetical protein
VLIGSNMSADWKKYQEETAAFFRELGLDAETDVTMRGVRTTHDVDVVVKSYHAGFDVTWLVECKLWQSKVSKLHVLALREIVHDVGADRGIILAESGFQSGAIEAATLTNVHVTSLAGLRRTASSDIFSMRLRELYDRIGVCKERYWDIPKEIRIQYGLRFAIGDFGYSGASIINIVEDFLRKAFRGNYPIEVDQLAATVVPHWPERFNDASEIVIAIDSLVRELEAKLDVCATHT